MSKNKFNIGDIIENIVGTQRYVIVNIDKEYELYICVDALCGRGIAGVIYKEYHPDFYGLAHEKDFKLYEGKQPPVVDDKYIEEYNLPKEWSWTSYLKREIPMDMLTFGQYTDACSLFSNMGDTVKFINEQTGCGLKVAKTYYDLYIKQ